jgi:hypothetical protein
LQPSNTIEFIVRINYLAAFFGSIFILFAACTKISTTDIGTGLIPAADSVITKDTFITVYAKNAGDSTIRPTIAQTHAVGYLTDPLFGITDARINFQLSLPSTNFYFENNKSNLFFDSVVLVLSYKGAWGDSSIPVTLHVNELDNNQTFQPDTSLIDAYTGNYVRYNNTDVFTASNSLTDIPTTIYPTSLDDSIHVFKDAGINMIRIRLNDAFGKRLLFDYDSTNAYKNDSTFHNYLKGFQVYAEAANTALLNIGLTDANTKLALYYRYHPKDSASTIVDTTVKYFTVNSSCAHSNYILRNRESAPISKYLPPNGNPDNKNDDYIFIQSSPGTYATITIDSLGLANMPNYIIHRAELLMERAEDPSNPLEMYLSPPNLFLLAKNDTSRFVIPGFDTNNNATADAVFSSNYLTNYTDFGGIPKKNTSNNSLYSFNVSRYVQGVITKHNRQHPFMLYTPYNEPFKLYETMPLTTAYGFVSSSPINAAGCGRVRLYGGDGDSGNSHHMRLHIVYSVPH